ncbi:hypothetical protein V8G54_002345 [Vigna mungo]|uniref:60S ribosomal protein L29 n=1 Tax=Vigna mungo TaxID=3915 RepID=A0AAQ3P7Y5_VIGMU
MNIRGRIWTSIEGQTDLLYLCVAACSNGFCIPVREQFNSSPYHLCYSSGSNLPPQPNETSFSKNHTALNQSYKAHKSGIKKPKRHRHTSTKVVQMDFAFPFASNLTLLPTTYVIALAAISLHNR